MYSSLLKIIFLILSCLFTYALSSQIQLDYLEDENLTFSEKVEKAETFFDSQGRGKGTGYKQFLRWKYIAQRSLDDNGYVLTENHNITEFEKFVKKNGDGASKNMATWVEKGPISATNTSTWSSHIGRLSNIAIDPNDDQHLVVTSLGGGVWKTLNEGDTWTPLFDQESTMSLQSALISHSNSNHYFIGGSGIWRSLDGGNSFTKLAGPNGTIYSIIMDPIDSDILLASNSNGTVWKTTNGGDSWTSVLLESSRRFYDLDFNSANSSIVYACGTNGTMYSSTDQGDTWSSLAGPWNSNRSIMFAVTPHDANYIYVLQEKSGGFDALYLSTDGGTTWTTQSSDDAGDNNIMGYSLSNTGGQAPRDMDIIVSPVDKTEVHVAGVMTFKSNDSGQTWNQTTHWVLSNALPFVHADIDQLIYHGSKIYVASDGGIFISTDGGDSFVDKTTGLGIRQFYRLSASSIQVGRVAGGSQDNGTGILREDGIWYDFMGADGMEPLIMNNDDDIVIGSIQFGQLNKSVNGGTSLTSIQQTQNGDSGEWVTPLERDPNQANTMYQGKKQLYKTVNAGSSWTTISNLPETSNMDEICIAPSNSNVIYVSYGSTLYQTLDGGEIWRDISTGTVGGYINYINIHPTNPDQVILAVSNSNHFIETTDAGINWTSIKHNLPNISSRSVVFDGRSVNGIYVSLSKGVYYKDDNSPSTWTLMDTGLPKVDARELEIVNDKLYVATYGRGLWEMPIAGTGWTLSPNYNLEDCISNGTPDPLDDSFTFSVDPKGLGLGTTYSVSGDLTENNIPYGVPFTFDNGGAGYLKQDGNIELTITDDQNSSIVKSFGVSPNIDENCYNNFICADAFTVFENGIYSAIGPSSGEGGSVSGRNANWFIFVPKSNGLITIRSCGQGKDTNLKISSGDCSSLTTVAAVDDNCSMGEGLNNYASELVDIAVNSSTIYYIEWDSRWSSDPFDFEFEFIAECNDYLTADVSSVVEAEYIAASKIILKGTLNGTIDAITEGSVNAEDLTIENQSVVNIIRETCELNDIFDVKILLENEVTIPDNGSIDIAFEFPSDITETVSHFSIGIDIEHPNISQLTLSLIKPDGTIIPFWEEECSAEEDLNFILDYQALTKELCGISWRKGYPVFNTTTLSQGEISSILNSNISGTWKLRFEDDTSGETGTINSAHIYFEGM